MKDMIVEQGYRYEINFSFKHKSTLINKEIQKKVVYLTQN